MNQNPNLLTVHAYSKLRGVTDTAIRKKVKDGTLIPRGRRKDQRPQGQPNSQ